MKLAARVSRSFRAIYPFALVLAAGSWLAGCEAAGPLDPQGPVAAAERTILFDSLGIMLAIVIPTILATLAFAWWFRASNSKATYLPDWTYSGKIELVVWSIPVLTVLLLGGACWIGSHELDPARIPESNTKPLEIQAVSLDWKWLFIYPNEQVATINQLVVPAGTPLHFSLTSASVMNAFFVPQLGSMIYTMNDMVTHLYLKADHEGEYYGRSSHFSGDGFPGMQFTVRAVSPQAYAAWVQDSKKSNLTLDKAAYTALTKQSSDNPPAVYRLADPNLFSLIATDGVPPAPGPSDGQVDASVSPRPGD